MSFNWTSERELTRISAENILLFVFAFHSVPYKEKGKIAFQRATKNYMTKSIYLINIIDPTVHKLIKKSFGTYVAQSVVVLGEP